MKSYSKLYIIILIILPFILSNCETVLDDFKLKTSEPQIVIDAKCSSFNDSAIVKITKTGDYMNPGNYPLISGAIVTLAFNDTIMILNEETPGRYTTSYNFPENTEYKLSVTIEGTTYVATSFMPAYVPIIHLEYPVSPYSAYVATYPGELYYTPQIEFLDPQNSVNFYRMKFTKNDTVFNTINDLLVTDDLYLGADTIKYEASQYFFKSNDTIVFEFQSIDKASYEYYITLREAISSTSNFSVPDNPKTNLSGGILGYFSAYSSDTIMYIIP